MAGETDNLRDSTRAGKRRERCPSLLAAAAALPLAAAPQPFASAQGAITEIEEVIVTARKREERLQDVPVSVAVLRAGEIELNRISNVTDAFGRIPGLYLSGNVLSPSRAYSKLNIRGIGTLSNTEPGVAVIVDGVYAPALSFDLDIIEVERIEVLRGPQGSLFGRNTEGGVINIVSRKPDDEFRAKGAFEVDDLVSYRAQGSLSGPLTARIFGSVALDFFSTDGYLKQAYLSQQSPSPAPGGPTGTSTRADDHDKIAGRAALVYRPNHAMQVYFSYDGYEQKGHDGLPGVPIDGQSSLVPTDCRCHLVDGEFQLDSEHSSDGASLTIDWYRPWADVTSIAGYRDLKSLSPYDGDGTSDKTGNIEVFSTRQRILSEELRIASKDPEARLQWLGGVYLFRQEQEIARDLQVSSPDWFGVAEFSGFQRTILDRDGVAAFGQVSYIIAERLDLTLGGRWSYEDVTVDLDTDIPFLDDMGNELFSIRGSRDEETDFSNFSPMASLAMRWSPVLMTYLTYAEGFKAGGFQSIGTAGTTLPFDSEEALSVEVGLKAKLLDGRLSLNAAAFWIDLEDQQVDTIIFVGQVPDVGVANAAKSTSRGFDLELLAQPIEQLRLEAGVGYTDAEFDEYIDTSGTDRAGDPFPFTPEWTGFVSAEYTFAVGRGLGLTLAANYRYVDQIISGSGNVPDYAFSIDAYDILDVRTTLAGDRWDMTIFFENVEDEWIEQRRHNSFFFGEGGPAAGPQYENSIVLPPRTIGARFSVSF
jgi:iron complex outermembrane receptor protein